MGQLHEANKVRSHQAQKKRIARLLMYREGFSHEDISLVTGMSKDAVRLALKRDLEWYEKRNGQKLKTIGERKQERAEAQAQKVVDSTV